MIIITANDHQVQPFEPLKNQNIDELSEEHAYLWTRFNKMQLCTLYMHLQVPDEIWAVLVSMTKIAIGESWTQMIPSKLGGIHEMHQLCSVGLSIILSQPFTTRYLGEA